MNNERFLKKLAEMKGKTFMYAKQVHCIIDYKISEEHEKVTIKTNLTTFDRKYESMDKFLLFWEPVSSVPAVITEGGLDKQVAVFVEQEEAMSNKLIGILEDSIKKVQANKEYIPQATQINNNVNSIINIQKMKMSMVKEIRKRF